MHDVRVLLLLVICVSLSSFVAFSFWSMPDSGSFKLLLVNSSISPAVASSFHSVNSAIWLTREDFGSHASLRAQGRIALQFFRCPNISLTAIHVYKNGGSSFREFLLKLCSYVNLDASGKAKDRIRAFLHSKMPLFRTFVDDDDQIAVPDGFPYRHVESYFKQTTTWPFQLFAGHGSPREGAISAQEYAPKILTRAKAGLEFLVVCARDPYSRFVSAFNEVQLRKADRCAQRNVTFIPDDFSSLVEQMQQANFSFASVDEHYFPFWTFLSPFLGKSVPVFVIALDFLEHFFEELTRAGNFPSINMTVNTAKDTEKAKLRKLLDASDVSSKLKRMIVNVYAEDYALFADLGLNYDRGKE